MRYRTLEEFYVFIPRAAEKFRELMETESSKKAKGSNHNHQTWEGGYLDHICETLNIAAWLYETSPRKLAFKLDDALMVMFLHDIEKLFKLEFGPTWRHNEDRRAFRKALIDQNEVGLTKEQWNALEYVEGEHDYSNTERKMGEMAAFCQCCDILSARLWHSHGKTKSW